MSKLDFVDLFGTDGTVAAEGKLLTFLALITNLQSYENSDDAYDNLALYILEAAEGDDDLACHRYLIATGIQYLAQQAQSAPAMEAAAATYISELLIRILQSEEPNKVFKRTKPTAGPKQYPKLDLILAVALPETRRRNRLVEIKNRLADRTISRRERASLNTELEMMGRFLQ